MSTKRWVKYQDYRPRQVSTEGCHNVGDFIKAIKKELQIPNPPKELSFSVFIDGFELEPEDPIPTQTGRNSHNSAKTPDLIDVVENDEVQGAPNSTCVSTRTYGIMIDSNYLERQELVSKLVGLLSEHQFVRLNCPPASGKSSLLQILAKSLQGKRQAIQISSYNGRSFTEELLRNGIDIVNQTITDDLRNKDTIVFLDHVRAKYKEVEFWELLLNCSVSWLPSNVRFIISTTPHAESSPLVLNSLPALGLGDFRLTPEQSQEFLELPFMGLPDKMQFPTLKHVLVAGCGGLIGALRQTVDVLGGRFILDKHPSETALLQVLLSKDVMDGITRCFRSTHPHPIGNDFKAMLTNLFANVPVTEPSLSIQKDKETV